MANQELVHQPVNGGAVVAAGHFHDEMLARLNVVKDVIAKGTTDVELQFFAEVCKRTGLDPFMKQIYCIKRGSSGDEEEGGGEKKITIQTGIDGFRIIAERTGKYDGQSEAQWCGDDGRWVDVWGYDNPPVAARVGVYRKDWNRPAWGVAHYIEYVQMNRQKKPTRMWAKMPAGQLAKCAEALALRKAFPMELSGLYTTDEMAQATVADEGPETGSKEAAQRVAQQKIETLKSQQEPKVTPKADQPKPASAAPSTGGSAPSKPAPSDQAVPADVQALWQRMSSLGGILSEIHLMEKDISEICGADAPYYAILSEFGLKHADKASIQKLGGPAARQLGRRLFEFIKQVKAEPPLDPTTTPADGWMDGMSSDIDEKFAEGEAA